MKLVSQRNLWLQITLVKLLKVIKNKSGKKLYLWNMKRTNLQPSFNQHNNQIPLLWNKCPPFTYFYKYQGMQLFQCMDICCTQLWKCYLYMIQFIDIIQSYSPVSHYDYLRINITITYILRITARIWNVSNDFQNKHSPINEILCVSIPPYNMNYFEQYLPYFLLNW